MPPLVIPATIQIDTAALTNAVLQDIVGHLQQVFGQSYKTAVKARMGAEAGTLIRSSQEYALLHGGVLQAELGVANPTQAIEDILTGLIQNIDVTVDGPRVSGPSLSGSVTASILRADFQDVLTRSGATYTSGKYTVEWLRWLLLEGDRIVIDDHAFLGNPSKGGTRKGSRTGLGIMRKGGLWRVPQFTGIATDNWLTRTLIVMEGFIANILVDELQKRF